LAKENVVKELLVMALLLSGSVLRAQNGNTTGQKDSKSHVTVTGCVDRSNGDYVLIKSDPAVTYELQASGKTRLKNYLGQRVEVTGEEEPTLSSSSDVTNRVGSAAPITLQISSIKMIDKNCSERGVNR
jgi:hypothetical protein